MLKLRLVIWAGLYIIVMSKFKSQPPKTTEIVYGIFFNTVIFPNCQDNQQRILKISWFSYPLGTDEQGYLSKLVFLIVKTTIKSVPTLLSLG